MGLPLALVFFCRYINQITYEEDHHPHDQPLG